MIEGKIPVFNSRRALAKVAACVVLTCALMAGSYWLGNSGIPLPGETALMQRMDKARQIVRSWPGIGGMVAPDTIPDEVLLVNVCYDKELVEVQEAGIPVGEDVITDRSKLLRLLQWADSLKSYRYILLDVRFPRGLATETDSALFRQILSMPRIVVPDHRDTPMQDSALLAKAGRADYMMFDEETNFTRYQFLHDGKASLPLRMYEELCGRTIEPGALGYTDGGRLCSNAVTLQLPVVVRDKYKDNGTSYEYTSEYLGSQLLEEHDLIPELDPFRDRIVVVGDFRNDVHTTYAGQQPGSLIALNAYYALAGGNHLISWGLAAALGAVFLLLLLSFSFPDTVSTFLSTRRLPLWLRLVLSVAGITTLFNLVAFAAYMLGHVYNCWPAATFFSVLTVMLKLRNAWKAARAEKAEVQKNTAETEKYKPTENEYKSNKTHPHTAAVPFHGKRSGGEVQDPGAERQGYPHRRQTRKKRNAHDGEIGGDVAADRTARSTEHREPGNGQGVPAARQNAGKKAKNRGRHPRVEQPREHTGTGNGPA